MSGRQLYSCRLRRSIFFFNRRTEATSAALNGAANLRSPQPTVKSFSIRHQLGSNPSLKRLRPCAVAVSGAGYSLTGGRLSILFFRPTRRACCGRAVGDTAVQSTGRKASLAYFGVFSRPVRLESCEFGGSPSGPRSVVFGRRRGRRRVRHGPSSCGTGLLAWIARLRLIAPRLGMIRVSVCECGSSFERCGNAEGALREPGLPMLARRSLPMLASPPA
jgi:hypothetical protein